MNRETLLAVSLASILLCACQNLPMQKDSERPPTQTVQVETEAGITEATAEEPLTYRHVSVQLPEEFSVSIDESGVFATDGNMNSRCGPTTMELTYIQTHLTSNTVEQEGFRCETRRHIKTQAIPDDRLIQARLICEVRGEFEGRTPRTDCDDIINSLSLIGDTDSAELEEIQQAVVRERATPALTNQPGEHELYLPGSGIWEPIIYIGSPNLDGESEMLLMGRDIHWSGTELRIIYQDRGQYRESELDYIQGRLWAAEIDEETTKPVDLFGELRDEADDGPATRCVRYVWSDSGYRADPEPCPDTERRGRVIFSN